MSYVTLILMFLGIAMHADSTDPGKVRNVLFFGDSITAGYGLDPEEAFPALIQQKADSAGILIRSINAGVSGETSAGGLARIQWVLRGRIDVFVLELGGNDALRGIPPATTYENLLGIIRAIKARSPGTKILLTGMEAPPNMGPDYTRSFRSVYTRLASETGVLLMPFILEDVGGEPNLNQPDGIHPTAEGHRIIAGNLWPYLLKLF